MKKMGRKTKLTITKEVLSEMEKLSGLGLTHEQISAYFGITRFTLNNIKNKNKKVKIALKKGKATSIQEVAGILMTHIRSGSLPAAIFYLKTQAGWCEKSTIEVKGKIKSKKSDYTIDGMDAIEASKIYQSIMTGSYNNERNSTGK